MLKRIISFVQALISPRCRPNPTPPDKSAATHKSEKSNSDETRSGAGDFISPGRKLRPERLPFTQWADVHRTERFVCIAQLSGYRIIQLEDDGYIAYLERRASDDALGLTLLEALARSRFIFPPDPAFSEAERYIRCYHNWQKDFMQRYGYKTKRDAYKNMDWCRVKRSEGKISIQPHKRDKPEYFHDEAGTLGAALRLALDRCE
jgi:hypothetical protein